MAQAGWGNSLLLVGAPKVVWGAQAVLQAVFLGVSPKGVGAAELPVHGFGAELVAE